MEQVSIENRVAKLLLEKGLTLSISESCTGGLLGHRLTDVAGSSGFFAGGVTAYSYDAKEKVLKIKRRALETYASVSKEIALEMAWAAQTLFASDCALAITGIAGPGGNKPGKPVGLTYIALTTPTNAYWQKHIWQGDRASNKQQSVEAALVFLEAMIK
ncbi:MAG TPA: CinA family protein [Chloroflexi bacterium]|nr:MAG: hypothetical protein B6243_00460 [Anaerolineaceae bacterium 4572_5.2]HEY85817.1 CinA family protein [Chloroflexota bacterium]